MSAIGPMFGQLGFSARGGKDYEEKRPQKRFADESKRLLGVLDRQLDGRDWIVDDYSIADIATLGWVNAWLAPTTPATYCGLAIIPECPSVAGSRPRAPSSPTWAAHSGEVSMSVIAAYYYNEVGVSGK